MDANTCMVVGLSGIIMRTTDAGSTWTEQTPDDYSEWLYGVSCVNANWCVAVGDAGTILQTTNGGSTWTSQSHGITADLKSVACLDTARCFIVGFNDKVYRLKNNEWVSAPSGTTSGLNGISCMNDFYNTCVAVGGRTIVRTTNTNGVIWTP